MRRFAAAGRSYPAFSTSADWLAAEVVEPWRRFQPYTGLPALTECDAAFFIGRDKETTEVLELLARARGRIVTLIGQSGVGKSSLVMAGVLSRLKSQLWPIEGAAWPAGLKDSRSYLQLTMRPGADPVKELAVGLVKLYRTKDESEEIEREASGWTARFREGSRLRDMLRLTRDGIAEAQGGYPPTRFVLYVDQGEELYTRAPKDEARLFSRLLADAAAERESFSVLLSLRSDFYTDAATGAQIGPAMTHDEPVNGALFNRDEGRILSWSNDDTLRLWDAAWRGGSLFEIACNHLPQTHDLARLSRRYGVRISDPICAADQKIPVPDWSKIEKAPQ